MNEKEIARLVKLATRFTGKSEADIKKALKTQEDTDALIAEIEEAEDTNNTQALEAEFKKGQSKVTGELGSLLKKLGFKEKIEKVDKEFVNKVDEFFKTKYTPEIEDPNDDPNDKPDDKKGKPVKDKFGKTSDDYRKEIADLKQKLEDQESEYEAKVTEANNKAERTGRLVEIQGRAKDALVQLKAIIPAKPEIAQAKLERFLKELDAWDYQKDPKTGDFFLLDENGDIIREGNKPVKLSEKLTSLVDIHYARREADQKDGNPPPKGQGEEGGKGNFEFKHYKGELPKNDAELNQKLEDFKLTVDQKAELLDWSDANPFTAE